MHDQLCTTESASKGEMGVSGVYVNFENANLRLSAKYNGYQLQPVLAQEFAAVNVGDMKT